MRRSRLAGVLVPISIAAVLGLGAPPAGAAPAGDAANGAAAVAASPEEINALVDQLGSDEFAKREQAARRLRAIGKPALPALQRATNHEDAEVASRAQALVKRLSVRPLPKGDPGGANGMIRATRMRMSVDGSGARVIDVTEDGREIQIRDGADGITLTVRGLVDGQPGSEEYTANTPEELKQDNPEAYALYERWAGMAGGGPGAMFGGRIQINGGALLLQPIPDEVDQLRSRLDKQMRDNKTRDADRDEVNKALDKLAGARIDPLRGMERYSQQCDELRKTLEQYKLDPGDLLPPPAKTRLGVSIQAEDGQLTVQNVGDRSRAQRLGIKPGDVIRKVDGKDVRTVGELRLLVGAKEKGMTVEVTRDGDDVKLEEKDAPIADNAK